MKAPGELRQCSPSLRGIAAAGLLALSASGSLAALADPPVQPRFAGTRSVFAPAVESAYGRFRIDAGLLPPVSSATTKMAARPDRSATTAARVSSHRRFGLNAELQDASDHTVTTACGVDPLFQNSFEN